MLQESLQSWGFCNNIHSYNQDQLQRVSYVAIANEFLSNSIKDMQTDTV